MREAFARRVATFLVLLVLAVVLSDQSGPFRVTLASAFESGFAVDAFADVSPKRVLTTPVLCAEEVGRLLNGEFTGPYRLGDAQSPPS